MPAHRLDSLAGINEALTLCFGPEPPRPRPPPGPGQHVHVAAAPAPAPAPRRMDDIVQDNVALLDNEAESDVEFVVGPDGDTWRIPGHRAVLSAASPVFKAMLTGPMAHGGPVRIEDIDGRAFYQLLRVLYGAQPEIRSEQTCLLTLGAANKYLCPRLFLHCVEAADAWLRPANALRVMQAIRLYLPDDLDLEAAFVPSAPPMEDVISDGEPGTRGTPTPEPPTLPSKPLLERPSEGAVLGEVLGAALTKALGTGRADTVTDKDFPDPAVEANMGWYCGALYWNCLQMVDAHADEVFECECVEELSHSDLVMLLQRPTLHVSREARLFDALQRWADRDCKRRGVKGCPQTRRDALGEALYLVRYLRMSVVDLLAGPIKSGLLDSHETAWILGVAVGNPSSPHPPDSLRPYAHLLAAPRPAPRPRYIHLSARSLVSYAGRVVEEATMTDWSCPVDIGEAELKTQAKALKQIAKLLKEDKKRVRRREDQRSGCCGKCSSGCFAEVFFSILAFIFD